MQTDAWIRHIQASHIPLDDSRALQPIYDAMAASNVVLLGEASHGTSEFYRMRAEMTKRLIRERGFRIVAVEGDYPSCEAVNRWVKRLPGAAGTIEEALAAFERWPQWMWANREIAELAAWMRNYNDSLPDGAPKAGFYGIDVYSLWESMEAILDFMKRRYPDQTEHVLKAFECFEPYRRDEQQYAVHAAFLRSGCEEDVVRMLQSVLERRGKRQAEAESELAAEVNAIVAVNAERYYRSMVRSDAESWNIRDMHMVEALEKVLAYYGEGAKAVVWEHNTHIGDARATDMAEEGMVNVGQILRERRRDVFAVGFGTHRGTVIAGREWGAALETMTVPPAERGSWEDLCHAAAPYDFALLFNNRSLFDGTIGHRAIGVVYRPQHEWGNYVPTRMTERYDAFIHLDETQALHPLSREREFAMV